MNYNESCFLSHYFTSFCPLETKGNYVKVWQVTRKILQRIFVFQTNFPSLRCLFLFHSTLWSIISSWGSSEVSCTAFSSHSKRSYITHYFEMAVYFKFTSWNEKNFDTIQLDASSPFVSLGELKQSIIKKKKLDKNIGMAVTNAQTNEGICFVQLDFSIFWFKINGIALRFNRVFYSLFHSIDCELWLQNIESCFIYYII